MPVLCLAGVALNIAINRFFVQYLGLPLFLDTILTVTVTLIGGLFWGTICGALHNIVYQTIWWNGWEPYLFSICSIATALITWLFIRFFPNELDLSSEHAKYEKTLRMAGIGRKSDKPVSPTELAQAMDRVIVLILLSLTLCIAISVLGGLISTFILLINSSQTRERVLGGGLSDTMFSSAVPVLLVEILTRIPVILIDRLITAFAGYGIAMLLKKMKTVTVTI